MNQSKAEVGNTGMTTGAIAKLLNVSRQTALMKLKLGEIPAEFVSNQLWIAKRRDVQQHRRKMLRAAAKRGATQISP